MGVLLTLLATLPIVLLGCASTADHPLTAEQKDVLEEAQLTYLDNDEAACSAEKLDGHFITIHRESKKIDESAQYEKQFACFVKGYLAYLAQRPNQRVEDNHILFHVNGGLNKVAGVRSRAKEQVPLMMAHGYYPVFLAWDSALLSSYGEQIGYVRNGIRRTNIQPTAPFSFLGDLLSPIPRAPVIWYNQTGRFIDSTLGSKGRPDYRLEEFLKEGHFEYARNTENLRVGDDKPGETEILRTARYAALTPLRLPLSVLAEDAGRRAWEGMIRRTRNAVHHPGEFDPKLWPVKNSDDMTNKAHRDNRMRNYPRGFGQFARLLGDIARCKESPIKCNPVGPRPWEKPFFDLEPDNVEAFHQALGEKDQAGNEKLKITLIGHSMGSMVLNELIPSFYERLPIRNIVYMGAAASIRETKIALEKILQLEGRETNFYSLMLHPLNEAREDSGFSTLPSGSLLEWIDEVLERPGTELDRTLGKWRNLRVAKHVFSKKAQQQMDFVVFPRSGRVPLTHGQFDATALEFWKPVFWKGETF